MGVGGSLDKLNDHKDVHYIPKNFDARYSYRIFGVSLTTGESKLTIII